MNIVGSALGTLGPASSFQPIAWLQDSRRGARSFTYAHLFARRVAVAATAPSAFVAAGADVGIVLMGWQRHCRRTYWTYAGGSIPHMRKSDRRESIESLAARCRQ